MHPKEFSVIDCVWFIPEQRFTNNIYSSDKEAREPGFPMKICDRTFELVKTHLAALDYHGPVVLACDDTKLFAALRLFWNKEEECYFLVGACDGPVRVHDVDVAEEAIMNPNVKKATKVCYVWFIY